MKKFYLSIIAVLIFCTAVAQKQNTVLNRSIRPLPGPPPIIKLGDIKSFELPNGLKVFVVENNKNPTIAYSITFNIHPYLEGDTAGIANITSELITSGTKNRSKDQLDNDIDMIGAKLTATPNSIYASSLSKQNKKLFELFADVLLNADFKQEELDKLKKQTLSVLAQEKDNPDAISENVKAVLNFGNNHPYGEIVTEQTINNITLDKCTNYFKTYFRPNIAYLAVVGDIKYSEVKSLVEKHLSNWQKADVPNFIPSAPTPPEKTRVFFVNKPGAVQSVINVTYPVNLKPTNDDLIKARVLNGILGGSFSSRLFLNLREKNGYTYGAYSKLTDDELAGQFSAYAKVRNAVTDSALTEIMSELKKLHSEKVKNDELESMKNYLTGNFAISLEDPATVARFAVNIERYHLPKDYYNNYLKNIAAITADDVYAAAQKYIQPDNANILVVGNEEEVAGKLASFSATGKIEYCDLSGNPLAPVIKPIPEHITPKSVIKAYINALGGNKKINAINDITVKRTADSQYGKITMVEQRKAPNKYNMTINIGETTIQRMVYDGNTGSQSGMQGEKEITGDELKELKIEAINVHEMYYEKLGFKLNLKGIEPINGNDAYILEVTSPSGKQTTEWYDVNNGLKLRSSQTTVSDQGSVTQIISYSDYKDIEGIKYPIYIVITGGSLPLKLELQSVEINKGINNSDFKTNL